MERGRETGEWKMAERWGAAVRSEDRRAAREERKGKEIKRVGGHAERQTHARPGRSLYQKIINNVGN
jgi:hypothetical protein